jgi:tetratricopeptide (TPR) repeat protein
MPVGACRRNAVGMDLRLGFETLDRYDLTHDERDLAIALRELTEAYEALPVDDIWRPAVCDARGRATRHKAEATGNTDAFDAAIDLLGEAVDTAVGHPLRYMFLVNLGRALADRYDRTGRPADLHEAERCYRAGLRLFPAAGQGRGAVLGGLSTVLKAKLDRGGDSDALREMIGYARQAVQASSDEPLQLAMAMHQLSGMLDEQAVRSDDHGLYVEALEWAERAVATPGVAPGDAATYWHGLGNAAKRLDLLDRAEAALRRSLADTPQDHDNRPGREHDLADVYYRRSQATGDVGALHEAVGLVMAATAATPPTHRDYPGRMAFLGNLLLARFRSTGGLSLIEQAIGAYRDAVAVVDAVQPNDAYRPMAWSLLGNGLFERAKATGDPGDAEQCLDVMHTAADLAQQVGSHRVIVETNLAVALREFTAHGATEAIDRMDRLIAEAQLTAYERVRVLHALGQALAVQGDPRAKPVLREAATTDPVAAHALADIVEPHEAALLYRQVATAATSSPRTRVLAWAAAGSLAAQAHDWAGAVAAYAAAVDNYRYLAAQPLDRADREQELSQFHGIATDAAACALHTGYPYRALELLERGRARLLSQLLATRGSLTRLRADDPERAERLGYLAALLDWQPNTVGPSALSNLEAVERRRTLQREYDSLLDPPPSLSLDDLPSPVVVVNVSRFRCDALIVSGGTITVVPLPALTLSDLATQTVSFATGDRRTLDWLWTTVAAPVLDAIGAQAPPQPGQPWPRIWWCPTGLLTFLPLHAAGDTIDRVISSYTPTVAVLADALHNPPPPTAPTQLVVTLPDTPGHQDLPGVRAEAARVPATTRLDGEHATRAALLDQIPRHNRLHFAGHAGQDPTKPGTARLQAHDAAVSLTDLAQLNLDHAQLAFLNACQTTTGHLSLADEAIHLAGALRTAGFPHVVATMWQVDDHSAAHIASAFYARLDTHGPAEALHHALRDARQPNAHPRHRHRDLATNRPLPGLPNWAPYLHIGP